MSDTDTVSDDEDLFVFEYINRIKLLMLFDKIYFHLKGVTLSH